MKITRDQVAFYGGLAIVGAFGIIEWPVLAVVGVGHWMVKQEHSKTLAEVGEALEDA